MNLKRKKEMVTERGNVLLVDLFKREINQTANLLTNSLSG
ncbi:hypothetical protein EFQH95_1206 [Enterococcus faecalis]|nr:hypothetical protein EFDM72_0961 [Enterococcus faecalis]OSH30289.1 hypothetical protein EFQH95_1206 [Enterococcus faecalis]